MEWQERIVRRRHLFEQPADDPFGFELLGEPLSSCGVPALFLLLPFLGLAFEPLLGEPDLFFADRQHCGLLISFGSELILQTAEVILEP